MAPFKFIRALALAGLARDQVDNTQASGTNPIGDLTVKFLGNQVADNSCSHRDLGFTGHLRGKWYAVYGDTLWCAAGVSDPTQDTDGFHGMVRDSVSALTDDALVVHDLHLNSDDPVAHQNQFVPFNETWGETNLFGFGGTSIVETDYTSGTGAVYYLVNDAENYKGAGVGKVELVDGVPTVTHRFGDSGWWWSGDSTPKYGDIAAYWDPKSKYIYILGNPPSSESGFPASSYVYQARVPAADAFDLSKYEYWWGRQQGWKSDVLSTFTSETAIMWGVGQGQITYNKHFKKYIYVHLGGSTVYLRSAPSPEGPWSADKEIYTATPIDNGLVYAGLAYPHLDTSGKTLTIGFTNNNRIQIIKVTFV
ncbi:hypothetical protein G7Z17_g2882 [Cylindrodendrum hubeiense]|uniref:DUF4185 domain-containing protein n=1 Tax=Cylindrodendrum hubeiense TaxID=595255 RepID=A0A9P5HGU4_9HYPO|nr:hypothetical protein G7Z17_g2882 [Cylindrodendrum hubeiense]